MSELFLPEISQKINNCYNTKLFKLAFYVPGIIFYVSKKLYHTIPPQFCYAYTDTELKKNLPTHRDVCFTCLTYGNIVFEIGNRKYKCRYNHDTHRWKIVNTQNSFDTYSVIDSEMKLSFFIGLGVFKIYDHAFDKQKAIFCHKNVMKWWLLEGYVEYIVVDLIFDKMVTISNNTDLIRFRIR